MSENLDLARSIYAVWERGEFNSVEWAHPEIEFATVDRAPPRSYTGLAGMAAGARDRLSAWQDFRIKADEYREIDDDRVLALHHFSGRGKTSGVELGAMQSRGAHLFHVRRGKITRLVLYFDRARALADLGLAPEADSP
jgi:ketosteroid isomerase-like protein